MNELEVRTSSTATAGVLLLLGHKPLEVKNDATGNRPFFRFPPSAEADLRKFLVYKQEAERMGVAAAVKA